MKNKTKSTAPLIGVLSQNEKRDKKHCPTDFGFCPKMKNETKSTAPLILVFVPK